MIEIRERQPEERILVCGARRGPKSKVQCEKPALHRFGCNPYGRSHGGRGRAGQWYFWIGPWSHSLRR